MNNLDILNLSDDDIDLVLEGLDALKSKDFGGKMMTSMLKSMLSDKLSPEDKERMEKEEKLKEMKEELERSQLSRKVDLVKARIILIREERK